MSGGFDPRRAAALTPAQTGQFGWMLLRETGREVARRWRLGLALLVGAALLAAFLFPRDAAFLAAFHFLPPTAEETARAFSYTVGFLGDFPLYNIPLALGLWLYGWLRGDLHWQKLAVIGLLGGALAGLFDDFFRLSLGRPRPDAGVPDGFYGLSSVWESKYQSFPSGHAAAVFGVAAAFWRTHRGLGLLTTAVALVVVWSRLELNRHWPSDVLIGSLIGIYWGTQVGRAALRLGDA